jgi:hypothetical protein
VITVNALLTAAALLTLAIAAVHSYLGEKYIVARLLRRDNLPRLFGSDTFTKQTIRFAWHLTTVAWGGLAFILLLLAGMPSGLASRPALLAAVGGTFLLSALLSLVMTRGRHLSWIVFLGIAALCTVQLLGE